MILSVITVVRNDASHIEKTIQSVLSQTYEKIEYIVIDGASTDGTVETIKRYQTQIDHWVSEPDKGLYDAMNKGLKKASGDYICFLNSGDIFLNSATVTQMFSSVKYPVDVLYGDTIIVDDDGHVKGKRRHRPPNELTWRSFKHGMLVAHQAFIPARRLTLEYDLTYKFTSDYDWCINILKNANAIHNTHQVLIQFLDGGISKQHLRASLIERFKIMKKNYGLPQTIATHIRNAFRMVKFKLTNGWV